MDRWNERYRGGERGPSHPASILVDALDLLPPGRALDLACGAGRNAAYLVQHGWSVVAVDRSTAAIEMVRQIEGPIETQVLDLERDRLPYSDASFDVGCIIHFMHRPLFEEGKRLLRPGGVV